MLCVNYISIKLGKKKSHEPSLFSFLKLSRALGRNQLTPVYQLLLLKSSKTATAWLSWALPHTRFDYKCLVYILSKFGAGPVAQRLSSHIPLQQPGFAGSDPGCGPTHCSSSHAVPGIPHIK